MEDFVHTIIDKERFETLQGLRELVSLHVKILFFLSIFFLILHILLITNKLKLFITEYNDRNAPTEEDLQFVASMEKLYSEEKSLVKVCVYILLLLYLGRIWPKVEM